MNRTCLWGILCIAWLGTTLFVSCGTQHTVSSAAEVAALENLKPGDVVVFRAGEYADQKISLNANGTEGKPIVFKAEQPGTVIFTGDSGLRISGEHIDVSGFWFRDIESGDRTHIIEMQTSDSRLFDCAITGLNTKPDSDNESKWVSLYGERNTVQSCSFIDKKNIGCLLVVWLEKDKVPNHKIIGNYFTRPSIIYEEDGDRMNGQEVIRIGTSHFSLEPANCTVADNTFYRCDGEIEVISNKSCYNTYRDNLFLECYGTLTMRHGDHGVVEQNYFIGNSRQGTGGVRVIGDHQIVRNNYFENLQGTGYYSAICLVQGVENSPLQRYFQVTDSDISGNTIVNCREGIVINYGRSADQSTPVISTVVENNVISNDNPDNVAVSFITSPNEPQITWANNTVYGGKYDGISTQQLPVAIEKPSLPDVTVKCNGIQERSGITWNLNN